VQQRRYAPIEGAAFHFGKTMAGAVAKAASVAMDIKKTPDGWVVEGRT